MPNRAIELHDSVLAAVLFSQGEVRLHFSSAFLKLLPAFLALRGIGLAPSGGASSEGITTGLWLFP
jgi:hypothetical protein